MNKYISIYYISHLILLLPLDSQPARVGSRGQDDGVSGKRRSVGVNEKWGRGEVDRSNPIFSEGGREFQRLDRKRRT